MPVITLTLSWNSGENGGWQIEICGRNESIDMSSYKFERVDTAPFHKEETGFFSAPKIVGDGPKVWLLTQEQEYFLGYRAGARRGKPPMPRVTQYLEALEEQGFKVVASHAMSFGENPAVVSKFVWTETGNFQRSSFGHYFPNEKSVVMGPHVWKLTPTEEPMLGTNNGAQQTKPPFAQITKVLEALEKQHCKVIGSHSLNLGYNSSPVSVWTLEQALPPANRASRGLFYASIGLLLTLAFGCRIQAKLSR